MNVRECYEAINGDYEEVKRRFLTDARIRRFALLFLREQRVQTEDSLIICTILESKGSLLTMVVTELDFQEAR